MTTINRIDGSVLFEREGSVREVVEALVEEGAYFNFKGEKIEIIKKPLKAICENR